MALSPLMQSFRVSPYSLGIDLTRSQYNRNLGMYVANASATFRAGMLVQLNSDREVIVCDGTEPMGFAKYNKTSTVYAAVVDEYIQLNGVIATSLAHANLFLPVADHTVYLATGTSGSGTTYTEGAGDDYTVSATNGTVTRTAGSSITDGGYVYATYQYEMTAAELKFHGRNFWNLIDDTTQQENKIAVIEGWSIIFTTMYDVQQTYAINDALTAGAVGDSLSGLVTKGGTGAFIGNVIQVPTADDPYLGIKYVGGMLS